MVSTVQTSFVGFLEAEASIMNLMTPNSSLKLSPIHLALIILLIFVVAALRVLPHPPNFSPVSALALFGGAFFARPILRNFWGRLTFALILPLGALFLSDLALGFHDQVASVYASFVLVSLLGFMTLDRRTPLRIGAAAVSGSLIFYSITNLTVWAEGELYARTFSGLLASYIAGLPFLENSLLGDLFFSVILFGAWAWLDDRAENGVKNISVLPLKEVR
jgi:hypothetical protein